MITIPRQDGRTAGGYRGTAAQPCKRFTSENCIRYKLIGRLRDRLVRAGVARRGAALAERGPGIRACILFLSARAVQGGDLRSASSHDTPIEFGGSAPTHDTPYEAEKVCWRSRHRPVCQKRPFEMHLSTRAIETTFASSSAARYVREAHPLVYVADEAYQQPLRISPTQISETDLRD